MTLGVDLRPNAIIELQTPIIAAPMDTVCEGEMALALCNYGALGVVHRYMSREETLSQVDWLVSNGCSLFGVAVSTKDCYDNEYISSLQRANVKVICVDTANGHSQMTLDAISELRKKVTDSTHIMTGNVSTIDGYSRLIAAGADSVRVGIGGGAACTTRIVSGHGAPTLWSVIDCAKGVKGGVIADGGIRSSGDMVKSFAAGSSAVMVGRLFAGHIEAPKKYDRNGRLVYRGMASGQAQQDWRGSYDSEEGVVGSVSERGFIEDTIHEIRYGIASGCSYSGVSNLRDLQEISIFLRSSTLTSHESSPRV